MERLNLWVQIFTSLAVLAGIGVVVWELQQTRSLFKTQMGMEATQSYTEHLSSLFGEDAAKTLEKACFSPDELEGSDLLILDAYFTSLMGFPFR